MIPQSLPILEQSLFVLNLNQIEFPPRYKVVMDAAQEWQGGINS